MGSSWALVFILLLTLQVLSISLESGDFHFISNSVYGERHSNNYCAMYDICGETSDGKVLNCPYGSPAVKPDDLFSAKVQSLCPTISGLVCCTESQFDTLRAQVQQAVPFLVGCPACLRNFLNLFCELSCSPRQSLFINVTSVSEVALPRDSYLQGYFQNISEYLRIGPPLYFVVKGYNYSAESKHTNRLCSISHCDSNSLLNEISRASLTPETSYIAKPAASWLDDFLVWVSPEAFGCCRKFVNGSYCPPDDQPPCCSPDDVDSCGIGGVCKDCTTCFRHSDLNNDRPSTVQFMEKLPWFLSALPSADCAKAGYGAYTTSVDLEGYETGIIKASEFRTYHTPLNKQDDYVRSMRAAREFTTRVSNQLKIHVFPYSVFYIFFEQYLDIWSTALINIGIALGAVFLVCLVITSSLWSSAIILLVLAMILVDLLGVMSVLNIQLNAVSVVNLIMSIGIAVEFCVHISHAFSVSLGDRETRAKEALRTMGSSVFSGITLTKFVGVIVLYFAKSEIFVVYYFQMYLALVILGFLHGLVFLPVILSMVGPPPRFSLVEIEESETLTSSSAN